ncbi:MAG: glycosyltransferase family 4 protein [Prevotella sp.]|nr:glycosyltransferase family 4 protein [Prevotella sp.]
MRVLIVNTSEKTGGAAVAAHRLLEALNKNGVKAKMLVRDKASDQLTVVALSGGWRQRWNFLWERWSIFWRLRFSRKHLFEIDIANTGTDITTLPEYKEADVIHLHWINQGMLSLKNIRNILSTGKPVVWTMHDLWPATAICHYARGCTAFTDKCRLCPLLPGGGSSHDLASKVWKRKEEMMQGHDIHFVTCSNWLGNEARKSGLIRGQHIHTIPNAIDTHTFKPMDKEKCRKECDLPTDRRIILFVSQRVTDQRKGMDYFIRAIDTMTREHPDMKENVGIAILGGHSEEFIDTLPLPIYPLGYVSDERQIVNIYNSADLFVLPSLEDNLPNTIMEALACGVPCVGFHVGGIPEMIDHKQNGYVAEYRDEKDLARGMAWVLDEADWKKLSDNAVKKVATCYSQQHVAMKYVETYQEALAMKDMNL